MGHNLNMYGDFLAVYNDGPDADAKKKIKKVVTNV